MESALPSIEAEVATMQYNDRKCRVALSSFITLLLLLFEVHGQEHYGGARSFVGTYLNVQFGYSIEIPRGKRCRGAAAPAPAHGCIIELDSPEDRIDISGDFSTLTGGVTELINLSVARVRRLDPEASIVSRERMRFGKLSGDRVVIAWREQGEKRVEKSAIAIRQLPGSAVPVVYTVRYSCRDVRRPDCEAVFERIVKSFKVNALK